MSSGGQLTRYVSTVRSPTPRSRLWVCCGAVAAHFATCCPFSGLAQTIDLSTCEIYSYQPDMDDEFLAGKLWAQNLFFYHKKAKK